MRSHRRLPGIALATLLSAATAVALTVRVDPATATTDEIVAGSLVRPVAGTRTPHVLDGQVNAVAQVGSTMVLGGDFSSVMEHDSSATRTRANLVAFNVSTGVISSTFLPEPNGQVRAVVPAGDGVSVYVAGGFTVIGGVARQRVARIRVSDGSVVETFDSLAVNGQVRDLVLRDGRLWMGGAFTHVSGKSRRALAALNPSTGAPLAFSTVQIAGNHNGGVTQVLKLDVTPDGSRLVAVGNFDTLAGEVRHQILMLDLTGPTAVPANWNTSFYTAACSSSFDSYMRDIDIAPSGQWFVVSTTGAYGGSTSPCDTAARFEIDVTGAGVQPSWVDYSGGDTSYAVEATESVIYIGGHQRWWNNPFAGDQAGQGAVSRPGIAALSPANGLPFSWNPTRTKGVGVFDFLITNEGLWVASDTDRIGAWQYKARIAKLPHIGGSAIPAVRTPGVPNDVHLGGPANTAGQQKRSYDGTTFGAASSVPAPVDWRRINGAFMLNGWLYLAHDDGTFTRRTFDGTTYGAPVAVDTADELSRLNDWRADLQSMTSMFYDAGRIYFTRSGSDTLWYRYFNPESDIVGARRLTASGPVAGFDASLARGSFATATNLYWADQAGNLRRTGWARGDASGTPTGATTTISGPGIDGVSWSAGALFLFQDNLGDNAPAPAGQG